MGEALGNSGQAYFYGAPTYRQAKMIAWNALKQLSPTWTVQGISESELRIDYKNGSELWIIGFDKRQRFEGKEMWNGGVLDEYAQMEKEVWDNTVEPALRDTGGWCNFIGRPEGKNHYYKLSEYARLSGDEEWDDFCWHSSEIMNPVEVEKARQRLDQRTFDQEYGGQFVSYEGRAYIYYDSLTHRNTQRFDDNYPLCICCDFNLDPCVWLISQDKLGYISFQDEIKQRQTDIWKMCSALKKRIEYTLGNKQYKHKLIFYGDYEHGQARSVSATSSSWQILRDEFRQYNCEFRLKGHPRIVDRVNSVNSKLRSADGVVKLGVDPKCIELNKDFEMVSMDMLIGSKEKAGERTHASDAGGYWINYEYPTTGKIIGTIR